ncbi:MAG: hypothetical protein D6791_16415 [Chloroflexi bacterium]|nr:MAG: hypothetical protein D6791_16415 [Chloroflexota bacterium]
MNSVERTLTVLDGGIPDRVPVDLHNFMMTAQASGMDFGEYFQKGEAMAAGQIAAWQEFGHDVVLLENGTAALAEACGCGVEYLSNSAPVVREPALKSPADISSLEVPDPCQVHPLKENLKATRLVVEAIGDRAFVMGRADQGPFSLAAMLLGMERFLFLLGRALPRKSRSGRVIPGDAELARQIHGLLAFCLEVTARYAEAQMDQGAHMTSIGDSLSGPDVCSPRLYREFAWGYARELVRRLKRKNIMVAYHICGNATSIVPDMVETGAAVLELDYKVDLRQVKKATQGRTAVLGPIDPSGVLALGTPEEVEASCRQAIEIMAPGGYFILGPGCALPPGTPAENVRTLIEAAKRYGKYARV